MKALKIIYIIDKILFSIIFVAVSTFIIYSLISTNTDVIITLLLSTILLILNIGLFATFRYNNKLVIGLNIQNGIAHFETLGKNYTISVCDEVVITKKTSSYIIKIPKASNLKIDDKQSMNTTVSEQNSIQKDTIALHLSIYPKNYFLYKKNEIIKNYLNKSFFPNANINN